MNNSVSAFYTTYTLIPTYYSRELAITVENGYLLFSKY